MYQYPSLYKSLYFILMSCHFTSRLVRVRPVLVVNRTILDIEPELLLLSCQLSFQLLIRVPDRLNLEETLNLLQRDTACFRDEEEGKEEGEAGQGGEEEVDAVAHCCEHLLGKSRYEEVEKPVAGGCTGLSQRAEVGVEEFLFAIVSTGG